MTEQSNDRLEQERRLDEVLGDYPVAVEILENGDAAVASSNFPGDAAPWKLAFVAMAYQIFGQVDQAKTTLSRLRRSMEHR
jgi:hypothetical protein